MSDPLETQVGRALRRMPLRRAPHSLESRVLHEIGRRAALPWWRRSFSHWPAPARIGFAGICGVIAALVLGATWPWLEGGASAGGRASAVAGAWAASWLPWVRPALILVDVTRDLDASLTRVIPPGWLYGALAAGAMLYAVLFGLGAAAYRSLYLKSFSAGEFRS